VRRRRRCGGPTSWFPRPGTPWSRAQTDGFTVAQRLFKWRWEAVQLRAAPVLCSRWMPLVLDVINFWVVESCMYWCRRPLRGGLFAHVLWVGDRLGRAAAAAGPISGVLCCSAAGLAEEWIRALRMSCTRVSQPGGFSPASDLGRRSVLRRTVGSRWRHSRRHTTPRRSADLRPPPRRPSRRRPTESPPTEPRTSAIRLQHTCLGVASCVWPCRLYVACSV
jgi:hypothetical protein